MLASLPAASDEEPVELDEITVQGIDQSLVLRAIQVALERKPSGRAEDLDKMVCWFDKATGSHQTFLYCTTNRVLEQTRAHLQGAGAPTGRRGLECPRKPWFRVASRCRTVCRTRKN